MTSPSIPLLREEREAQRFGCTTPSGRHNSVVAEGIIYHITERESWDAAQAAGEYVAESLAVQGFIHASTREQVFDTANLLYAGQDALVLLRIDPALLTAPLRREAASDRRHGNDSAPFPHIYGP